MTEKKQNGKETPKNEVKADLTIVPAIIESKPATKPTYEELEKKLQEFEAEKLRKPASIQEVIKFFEDKKAKINHLEALRIHRNSLFEAVKLVKSDVDKAEFETKRYTLSFGNYNDYRSEPIVKISNSLVVGDCLEFLIARIKERIVNLEKEIAADF